MGVLAKARAQGGDFLTNNIRIMKLNAKTKRISRILSIILVVFIMISMACTSVAADSYNSFGLNTSQLDRSYFYIGGSTLNPNWDLANQNAWCLASNLSKKFNVYIVSTDINENLVKQIEYLYDNGYRDEAISYKDRWNTIRLNLSNLLNGVSSVCSSGSRLEAQNYYDELSDIQVQLISLAGEITESYQISTFTFNTPDVGSDLSSAGITILDYIWKGLGTMLRTIGTNSTNTDSLLGISWTTDDIQSIVDTVSGITKTFAYAIACILFGINVTTTSLQYEILTLRGGVKVFGRVLLVKIWIDLAIPICMYALNIINSLARQIFTAFFINNTTIFQASDLVQIDVSTNNSFLDSIINAAEGIINFFANFIVKTPALIIIVFLVIAICSVLIKVIARAFELTSLIAVSPLFFSTLVGEETKQYFKKFVSAFLSTAGYIVFVTIVYVVASKWIQQCTSATTVYGWSDLVLSVMNLLPKALIIIACCRIMRKPPKVLTSLFDGG